MQETGIGSALRHARLLRGKSIEEVSRETRIRTDYIQALERERFESLRGDVYVRGCLRSYSTYLGIDADQVLTVYNRHFGGPREDGEKAAPIPAPVSPSRRPPFSERLRKVPSWTLLAQIAVVLLGILAAVGLLSRYRSTPPPGALSKPPASVGVGAESVTVALNASQEVEATVRTDGGQPATFVLRSNETRTFQAAAAIQVHLARGGAAEVIVNGRSLGRPGTAAEPYEASFGPQDYRSSPSPNGP